VIEEVDFGAWGIGGNPVTPEMLQQAGFEGRSIRQFNP
jgi:hypothetical protein